MEIVPSAKVPNDFFAQSTTLGAAALAPIGQNI